MTYEISDVSAVDPDHLIRFLERASTSDRTFFREDVLAPGVVEGWTGDTASSRFAAHDADGVLAVLTISPGVAWSSHVGEIRIVVDAAARRRGIGKALARKALLEGVAIGLSKLVVQVAADDEATIQMFAGLAFRAEALLRAHVRDDDGVEHDLLVLSHFVDDVRGTLAALGFADALGSDV